MEVRTTPCQHVGKVRDRSRQRIKSAPIPHSQQPTEIVVRIRLFGGGIGILAAIVGLGGLIRKESRRLVLTGMVLGLSAIFLKYAIIVLILAGILLFLLRDYI